MAADYVEQTLRSGVAPLEIEYYPFKSCRYSETIGYRSVLKINSVNLGTLYPSQYRLVTNRNAQSIRLATWTFKQVVSDVRDMILTNKLPGIVSIYIPTKMLMRQGIDKLFETIDDNDILSHMALEFSSDLLLEDPDKVTANLTAIKKKYSVVIIMNEYGDSFCPTLRLCSLPVDKVILDETVCNEKDLESAAIKSAVSLAINCGMEVYLDHAPGEKEISLATSLECSGFCDARGKSLDEVIQ